jgi:type IV conjugative transfer system protein TraL
VKAENHYILKHLDNPTRILFWDSNEVLLLVFPFFLGVLVGSMILMLAGVIALPAFRRVKKLYPKGFLLAWMYWSLPYCYVVKFNRWKSLPPSYLMEVVL